MDLSCLMQINEMKKNYTGKRGLCSHNPLSYVGNFLITYLFYDVLQGLNAREI